MADEFNDPDTTLRPLDLIGDRISRLEYFVQAYYIRIAKSGFFHINK